MALSSRIPARSAFREAFCDWPAARWTLIKQMDVSSITRRETIAPLFPYIPPIPLFLQKPRNQLSDQLQFKRSDDLPLDSGNI